MIRHIFTLLWNRKASNALMLLEIFLVFLVLFAVLSYVLFAFQKLHQPLGFDTNDRLVVRLDYTGVDSASAAITNPLLKQSLLAEPQVQAVAFCGSASPFSGSSSQSSNDEQGFNITSLLVEADEDFQKALNIKLVGGRWFTQEDENSTVKPILVNQLFIDDYFPGKNMLDSVINFQEKNKIIGIVEDYKYKSEFDPSEHTTIFYRPTKHEYSLNLIVHLKPNTPAQYEEKLSSIIAGVVKNKRFVITDLDKLRTKTSRSQWILLTVMLGLCVFLGLNVALGLFGVLWYNIQKRKAEFGLRRALGAHSSQVQWQLMLEILLLVVLAVGLGLIFTIQVPLLKLIDINQAIFYKAMLLAAFILLALVAVCALYPSRLAAQIHPATALHED